MLVLIFKFIHLQCIYLRKNSVGGHEDQFSNYQNSMFLANEYYGGQAQSSMHNKRRRGQRDKKKQISKGEIPDKNSFFLLSSIPDD